MLYERQGKFPLSLTWETADDAEDELNVSLIEFPSRLDTKPQHRMMPETTVCHEIESFGSLTATRLIDEWSKPNL
ncbi:hypothetical protein C0J52_26799 [Blattella germanica]|nr:hypothetical protein C0J52_26799 [Blattella germanica]